MFATTLRELGPGQLGMYIAGELRRQIRSPQHSKAAAVRN